jgi:phage gp29-like protein
MVKPDTREFLAHSSGGRGDLDELTPWQVDDARVALADLREGVFESPAELADEMSSDDRLENALDTLALGVCRLPFRVDLSADGDQRRAPAVARDFQAGWFQMCREPVLMEAIRWLTLLGFCVIELVWTFTSSAWRPRCKVWDPRWLWYRRDLQCYVAMTTAGPVVVEPNRGKWIVLELAEGERAWKRAAIRTLAKWWLLKTWCARDWGRKEEQQGLGILKAKVPSNADDGDKKQFAASIANLGSETTVECPVDEEGHGFDVELLVEHLAGLRQADLAVRPGVHGPGARAGHADRGADHLRSAARIRQDPAGPHRGPHGAAGDCLP